MDIPGGMRRAVEEGDCVVVRGVPVFHAHGDYTDNDVREICRNSEARARAGEWAPISIGHTPSEEGVPQPPVVGYATAFRLGRYKDRLAIFADFKFDKSLWPVAQRYQRRSVEVWRNKKIIDPIALLGAETPRLDLGPMTSFLPESADRLRAFRAGQIQKFSLDEEDMMLSPEDIQSIVQALMSNDEFKTMVAAKPVDDVPLADVPLDPAADKSANTYVPEMGGGKPGMEGKPGMAPDTSLAERAKKEADKFRLECEDLRTRMARAERELQESRDRHAMAEVARVKATREATFKQLTNEGYELELSEELPFVEKFSEEQFSQYVATIRKRYKRSHGNVPLMQIAGNEALDRHSAKGDATIVPPELKEQVVHLRVKEGITTEAALAKLRGSK